MLRGGIPIGRAFGIPIRLHYSWFVIFILVTWALAANYFPVTQPTWSLGMKIGAGLVTSLLFFGSVLLHELMHSLVAIKQGTQVQSITLFILGGVSQITGEPRTAKDEFRMAGAGPLSSLVLGGIFFGVYFALQNTNTQGAQFGAAIAYYLGYINILLGVFNLIPGFPLDGGRVLRSIIWGANHNLRSATRIASNIGRAVGYVFIFGGVVLIFSGNFFNGIWIALIGWFLESAAAGSYRQVALQDILRGHMVSEIMTKDCLMVSSDITVEKLVNEFVLTSGRRCFPVVVEGRVLGLVTLHNIKAVPREQWSLKKVREVMTPMANLKWVQPGDELSHALQVLTENDVNQLPVIQDSNIVGMIGRDNVINFVEVRSGLGV